MSATEGTPAIRVVIAEDQAMVRGALAALLGMEHDIAVVGEADNGAEALAMVRSQRADVCICDIEMPGMNGLDVARALGRDGATRVLMVTTFARAGYLRRAMDAGASGYVLKDRPARELADAVRRVHRGLHVVDPELAAEALGAQDPLTDRERQILRLAGEGLSNGEIAVRLGLSDGTVRNYVSDAIVKMHADNRTDAARLAHGKGWL